LEPEDPDASQTKLFLLLQTEQYDAALALIDHDGENPSHPFETAYSLYRLQRESEARDIVKSIKDDGDVDNRGVIHLEAQLVRGFQKDGADAYSNCRTIAKGLTTRHSNFIMTYWTQPSL
jgi:signal recognition particle subunit SRP72